MITILTHSPYRLSSEFIKNKIKKILRVYSGPKAVLQSLEKGLEILRTPFQVNPHPRDITSTVHVLSGGEALRYAITLKKRGVIKKLIAGPNIAVLPTDHEGVLLDPAIDIILQPSLWTKDVYSLVSPEIEEKIKIWAAGTNPDVGDIPPISERKYILLYQKNAPFTLLEKIKENLESLHVPYKVISYGSHSQKEYFCLLKQSRGAIFLSQSESQGMALQEAWMHDVPTFVWDRGYIEYAPGKKYETKNVGGPYLSEETGISFTEKDIPPKLALFLERITTFTPRKYALTNLTDTKAAENYLDILK